MSMDELREKIVEIFKEMKPDLDIENTTNLIDGGFLDSFDVIEFVSEAWDAFNIDFPVSELVPENFSSASKILETINKVKNS